MRTQDTLLQRLNPVYIQRMEFLEKTYKHTYEGLKNNLKSVYYWTELKFSDVVLLIQLEPDTDISISNVSRMFEQKETLNTI